MFNELVNTLTEATMKVSEKHKPTEKQIRFIAYLANRLDISPVMILGPGQDLILTRHKAESMIEMMSE